jgi:hypothetical protein
MKTIEIWKRGSRTLLFLCIFLFLLPLSLYQCGFKAPPSPLFDEAERFGEAKDARGLLNNQFSKETDGDSHTLKWPGSKPTPTPEPESNIFPLNEPTAR